jgi:hypothetical protein
MAFGDRGCERSKVKWIDCYPTHPRSWGISDGFWTFLSASMGCQPFAKISERGYLACSGRYGVKSTRYSCLRWATPKTGAIVVSVVRKCRSKTQAYAQAALPVVDTSASTIGWDGAGLGMVASGASRGPSASSSSSSGMRRRTIRSSSAMASASNSGCRSQCICSRRWAH